MDDLSSAFQPVGSFLGTTDLGNSKLPDATSSDTGSLFSGLGGLLSNLGNRVIDSKFPTGNTTPQNAAGQTAQAKQSAAANQAVAPFNWRPYAIGGGVAVGVVLLALIIGKASK